MSEIDNPFPGSRIKKVKAPAGTRRADDLDTIVVAEDEDPALVARKLAAAEGLMAGHAAQVADRARQNVLIEAIREASRRRPLQPPAKAIAVTVLGRDVVIGGRIVEAGTRDVEAEELEGLRLIAGGLASRGRDPMYILTRAPAGCFLSKMNADTSAMENAVLACCEIALVSATLADAFVERGRTRSYFGGRIVAASNFAFGSLEEARAEAEKGPMPNSRMQEVMARIHGELTRPLPPPAPEATLEEIQALQRRQFESLPRQKQMGMNDLELRKLNQCPKSRFLALRPHSVWVSMNESRWVTAGEEYVALDPDEAGNPDHKRAMKVLLEGGYAQRLGPAEVAAVPLPDRGPVPLPGHAPLTPSYTGGRTLQDVMNYRM